MSPTFFRRRYPDGVQGAGEVAEGRPDIGETPGDGQVLRGRDHPRRSEEEEEH